MISKKKLQLSSIVDFIICHVLTPKMLSLCLLICRVLIFVVLNLVVLGKAFLVQGVLHVWIRHFCGFFKPIDNDRLLLLDVYRNIEHEICHRS